MGGDVGLKGRWGSFATLWGDPPPHLWPHTLTEPKSEPPDPKPGAKAVPPPPRTPKDPKALNPKHPKSAPQPPKHPNPAPPPKCWGAGGGLGGSLGV